MNDNKKPVATTETRTIPSYRVTIETLQQENAGKLQAIADQHPKHFQLHEHNQHRIIWLLNQCDAYPEFRKELLQRLLRQDLAFLNALGQSPALAEYERRISNSSDMQIVRDVFGTETQKQTSQPTPESLTTSVTPQHPSPRIIAGRYRIEKLLGSGGFGEVLLATDTHLNIKVALKLPIKPNSQQISLFRREASVAASLAAKLPQTGVVRVTNLAEHQGLPVIVMDYVEGQTLRDLLDSRPNGIAPLECVAIARQLCEILQATHEQGCYHRDLKPANVLRDIKGKLWLLDFGLVLLDDEWANDPHRGSGTLRYMAPDHLRAESHRVTGRVDLWSLGVMLYQMLTGELPFLGKTRHELLLEIAKRGHRNLRQRDRSIPQPLSLIVDKCLRREPEQRYDSAADLLIDLDDCMHKLQTAPLQPVHQCRQQEPKNNTNSTPSTLAHIPNDSTHEITTQFRVRSRGLESYDERDHAFFLQLLPGDVEPNGLPSTVNFWLERLGLESLRTTTAITPRSPDVDFRTSTPLEHGPRRNHPTARLSGFSVGIIHGSSGCGKSSFVKAGLLPLIPAQKMDWIYVEAMGGADSIEKQLLQELRRRYPLMPHDILLPDAFRSIREGQFNSPRLLIVIDQFEQWLDQNAGATSTRLAEALRQCASPNLHALLVVREEFWTSLNEFFTEELGIPLDTRKNDQTLSLFSSKHAKTVLAFFGNSWGTIPNMDANSQQAADDFLEAAVTDLARLGRGRVAPIQLAVFAEMFRESKWSTQELQSRGGAAGVVKSFLNDYFAAPGTPEKRARHRAAAQLLLEELLPPENSNIRGQMRAARELRQICGYSRSPTKFVELIQLLESGLRLIVRRDPMAARHPIQPSKADTYYMLTHDFLVPSIREWVEHEMQLSRKGRAVSKLRKLTKQYREQAHSRHLPSISEWLEFRFFTDPRLWTPHQRNLMRLSGRRILALFAGTFLAVAVLTLGAALWYTARIRDRELQQIDFAIEQLAVPGPAVRNSIDALKTFEKDVVARRLVASKVAVQDDGFQRDRKLGIAMALAEYGDVNIDLLLSILSENTAENTHNTRNLIQALSQDRGQSLKQIQLRYRNCDKKDDLRVKAKFSILALGLGFADLAADACAFESRPDPELRTHFIDEVPNWGLDWTSVVNLASVKQDSALRSAICLGLGQIRNSSSVLPAISGFVNESLKSQDPTTRSAAKWLLRSLSSHKFKADPAPRSSQCFTNVDGVDFVLIAPRFDSSSMETSYTYYSNRLKHLLESNATVAQDPELICERAYAFLAVGETDRALANYTVASASRVARWRIVGLQGMAVCNAKKRHNVQAHVMFELWKKVSADAAAIDYMEIIIPLYLGDVGAAKAMADTALARVSRLNPNSDATVLLNLASAIAAFSATDPDGVSARGKNWADEAVGLLEMIHPHALREQHLNRPLFLHPDFVVLRGNERFNSVIRSSMQIPERPYWIASVEVTRGEYERFITDLSINRKVINWQPDDNLLPTARHPAHNVEWHEAILYCNWLSKQHGRRPAYLSLGTEVLRNPAGVMREEAKWQVDFSANGYRLPLLSESAYACRAGTTTEYSSGNSPELALKYCRSASDAGGVAVTESPLPVGSLLPNAWGLHDMQGNVWEWCWDDEPLPGNSKSVRGGSSEDRITAACKTNFRHYGHILSRHKFIGFRLAVSEAGTDSD